MGNTSQNSRQRFDTQTNAFSPLEEGDELYYLERFRNRLIDFTDAPNGSPLCLRATSIDFTRAVDATVDCIVLHHAEQVDLSPDFVQAWADINRPGVVITEDVWEIGFDWWDEYKGSFHTIDPGITVDVMADFGVSVEDRAASALEDPDARAALNRALNSTDEREEPTTAEWVAFHDALYATPEARAAKERADAARTARDAKARGPETMPPLPLIVIFADALPDAFEPPDEIVQGLLTAGDGSVWYGDSNSGKTFVVIGLGCAIGRGVSWMGRRTEPGLVIYLAAESPASVRSRLQAYQKHHGVRVPNFAVVQSPIDLFDGEADTDKIIKTVRQIEQQRGMKARLIVGDTLARLSAGANENAGQDMGLIVRRFDRIRTECDAHFLLIHHSGKNTAAGARGWSGVRAAVDTEIEITDTPAGRCIEITKQRDLSTKGERIGFRLQPVTLGQTKWGAPATSCVVVATDAPDRIPKRASEVGGAILEMLRASGSASGFGVKKRDVVAHFLDQYTSSAVYRELKKLVAAGAVIEKAGTVAAVGFAG